MEKGISSTKEILLLSPQSLLNWLTCQFWVSDIPEGIHSIDDMRLANTINLQLASYESYLNMLSLQIELLSRDAKRNKSKTEQEDMIDRKKIIQGMADIIKHQREALSRSVTIYTKILEEEKNI